MTPPATSSTTDVRIGVCGAVVSTVRVKAVLFGLLFPAASVATAVMTCVPLANVEVETLHAPSG
ncbi:Uncharacterised protein [Salmonella enterica subsp. enterica serovar Typhi]|nr:Uncharacterised protein [Salmonella enterica subsp. enterica serovar Typhi]CGX44000.1 Uncharacterised protein [Salmonella enterica subsp. enterica serovar Typhi]CGZ08306.1 Uncharacterised protein [Salmonella enterica subsp. enterica serovar Typhi]CGZ36835.1 Uncharacterised protein [Salmonella enterica subsp. enterica serovar Typhi]CHA75943.1 Uncharacterised protein [Salmonella enterica subsp. enterica serovar Typhi]